MLGLMIFDHLNDVIFLHCDAVFTNHVNQLAIEHGLLEKPTVNSNAKLEGTCSSQPSPLEECTIDPNVIIQLFSPLVASQCIMEGQFGNSYETIECKDGTKLIFKQYMDFIFICIGHQEENFLERYLNICILLVKITVGPSVSLLKRNPAKSKLLSSLLSTWQKLYSEDQSYLVEALDRVIVDAEISTSAVKTLTSVADKVKKCNDLTSGHALFFVRNKLLALYSSPHAQELSSADMLLLNLLLETTRNKSWNSSLSESVNEPTFLEDQQEDFDVQEFGTPQQEDSLHDQPDEPVASDPQETCDFEAKVFDQILFLRNKRVPLCPHIVYLFPLSSDLSLLIAFEMNRSQVAGELINFLSLVDSLKVNLERHKKSSVVLDSLDSCLRKAQEYTQWLPKSARPRINKEISKVLYLWDNLKKTGLHDWLKSSEGIELPSRLESTLSTIKDATIQAWQAVCFLFDFSSSLTAIKSACKIAQERMSEYIHLLEPTAARDSSLRSSSLLTINKYMEDFPGLVHFLYIDRTHHILTAPMLYCSGSLKSGGEAVGLTERVTVSKVWAMVDLARENLTRGHVSLLWKDKTFSYSYFLWFEDSSGNPLLAESLSKDDIKSLPQPGILCDDYYKSFISFAFPGIDPSKVRVYEMFCIHLGLATSPCILEQTRRLAATVWEISGHRVANPLDLF